MKHRPLPRPFRSIALALVALAGAAASGCSDNLTHPAEHDAYTSTADVPLSCVPNLDGKLEADELGFAVGVTIDYLVSPPGEERPVDLAGKVDSAGKRIWDWSADDGKDELASIAAAELTGTWFAESFTQGQYVAPFDVGGSVLGVYRKDAQAVWLLGLASAEPDPPAGKTLVVYDDPIALYRFPIEPDATWTSSSTVQNGTLRGLPYAGKDTYEARVAAAGRMVLPPIEFTQAQEVLLSALVEPAVGTAVRTRQASFLFECFGEVARATSKNDEKEELFTTATEVRRLGL